MAAIVALSAGSAGWSGSVNSSASIPELMLNNDDFPQGSADQDGLKWQTHGSLQQPLGVCTKKTTIKKEHLQKFSNPLSSLLAILPIEFWKLCVFATNNYARWTIANSEKSVYWTKDCDLRKMMLFFSILIRLSTRPTPRQCYTAAWSDRGWHPYTNKISLHRFKSLRTCFSMSEKGFAEESSKDGLYKSVPCSTY